MAPVARRRMADSRAAAPADRRPGRAGLVPEPERSSTARVVSSATMTAASSQCAAMTRGTATRSRSPSRTSLSSSWTFGGWPQALARPLGLKAAPSWIREPDILRARDAPGRRRSGRAGRAALGPHARSGWPGHRSSSCTAMDAPFAVATPTDRFVGAEARAKIRLAGGMHVRLDDAVGADDHGTLVGQHATAGDLRSAFAGPGSAGSTTCVGFAAGCALGRTRNRLRGTRGDQHPLSGRDQEVRARAPWNEESRRMAGRRCNGPCSSSWRWPVASWIGGIGEPRPRSRSRSRRLSDRLKAAFGIEGRSHQVGRGEERLRRPFRAQSEWIAFMTGSASRHR